MVITAASAGYCFGVKRAVSAVEERLAKGERLCTLGKLTNNEQAVEELARRGAVPVEDISLVDTHTVAIRSHGVRPEILKKLTENGHEVLDLTCPFVKRIHDIVHECHVPVIVAGKRTHPEVIGTCGWCERSFVVADENEAAQLPEMDEAMLVAQTTYDYDRFEKVRNVLEKRIKRLTWHNTVCPTSRERQRECAELAAKCDLMVVVGGYGSSNTRELYNIASGITKTIWTETAQELPKGVFAASYIIGITAGASTPDVTLKEVSTFMTENEIKQVEETAAQEYNFMDDVDRTIVQIHSGDQLTGTVVQITEDEVCVNIGYKADGLLKKSELCVESVAEGDEIEVEVVKVNDGEGNVILSQKNIASKRSWDAIKAKNEAGEFIEGVGKKSVKGGLIADVMGIEAFIPASQLSSRFIKDIDEFVGKQMKLKVIELDDKKRRIVASRKDVLALEEAAKKEALWSGLEVGQEIKGTVRRLTDFGAFVDIGGADGLVHITELSWNHIKNPAEVVSINQEITVRVMSLDRERDRIGLSYKATQPKPWDNADEKYPVGSIVEGKVVRICTFGAFVELEPGLDGLVHISQCALTRVAKVEDVLSVGQVVRVKVTAVDTEKQRISLSVSAALKEEALDSNISVDAIDDEI